MRFLADESCDFTFVRGLRQAAHAVKAVSETAPRSVDAVVLKMALAEDQILLTEDKDFGRLVYAAGQTTRGVILLRYPFSLRNLTVQTLIRVVTNRPDALAGAFTVVQPGRVRFSRIPRPLS